MGHIGRNGLQNHHLSDALANQQNSDPANQVQVQAQTQQSQQNQVPSQSQVPNQVSNQNNSSNVNTPQQVQASTPSNTPSEIHGYRTQTTGGRQATGDHWQSTAETVITNHVNGLSNALRDTMNSFREELRAEYENEIKEQRIKLEEKDRQIIKMTKQIRMLEFDNAAFKNKIEFMVEQMEKDNEGQTNNGKREGTLDDPSEAGTGVGTQEEMGNRTMSPNNYNLTSSLSKEHLE